MKCLTNSSVREASTVGTATAIKQYDTLHNSEKGKAR